MKRLTIRTFTFTSNYIKGKIDAWSIAQALNKLQEYENAEEDGLLLRLPCPIGSTVYAVVEECEGDYYDCSHSCETCNNRHIYIVEEKFNLEYLDEIGKWIFLTKAEAEQALAEKLAIEKAKDNLAEKIARLGLTDKADARDRIECALKQMGEVQYERC